MEPPAAKTERAALASGFPGLILEEGPKATPPETLLTKSILIPRPGGHLTHYLRF